MHKYKHVAQLDRWLQAHIRETECTAKQVGADVTCMGRAHSRTGGYNCTGIQLGTFPTLAVSSCSCPIYTVHM